jgi:hypothetical protein
MNMHIVFEIYVLSQMQDRLFDSLVVAGKLVRVNWRVRTPSGAVKEVILRVTERAQKEVIARVGLGFGRCYP